MFDATLTLIQSGLFAAAAGHPGAFAGAMLAAVVACLVGVCRWGETLNERG